MSIVVLGVVYYSLLYEMGEMLRVHEALSRRSKRPHYSHYLVLRIHRSLHYTRAPSNASRAALQDLMMVHLSFH